MINDLIMFMISLEWGFNLHLAGRPRDLLVTANFRNLGLFVCFVFLPLLLLRITLIIFLCIC